MAKPDYDTTLARIAGNIAAGLVSVSVMRGLPDTFNDIAHTAVSIAQAIVAELKRTEAPQDAEPTQ